jgi:hypothetical protein
MLGGSASGGGVSVGAMVGDDRVTALSCLCGVVRKSWSSVMW